MHTVSVSLFLFFALTCVAGQSVNKQENVTPEILPVYPSTPLPPVSPSTKKPTTSTTPPTTTPITTSTTTPKTTTSPTTTTSTPAPKPTPPPPAPQPPKNVDPETHTWAVNYTTAKNFSCIVVRMAMQVNVPYPTKDNKTWTAYVDVPANATVQGNCGKTEQNLTVSWKNNSVDIHFAVNGSDYYVNALKVHLKTNAEGFPNIKNISEFNLENNKHEFTVNKAKSYKCSAEQKIELSSPQNHSATIHVKHLQLQAFANTTSQGFQEAVDCASTPDIVPIAVGCALAALILIIVAGYLINRRRSQAHAYLSMFSQTKREEDYIPMKNLSCFN